MLDRFWAEFWNSRTRILVLRRYADIKVQSQSSYIARRRGSGDIARPLRQSCHACQVQRATIRHHIIQLQHGGSNRQRNVVYLCGQCHAEIHPWLMEAPELPEQFYRPIWR